MDSFTCHVGDRLHGRIEAILDENGEPTTLPAIPVWGSDDLSIAVPTQRPDGRECEIEVVGAGNCDIYLDTGVSPEPGKLVQGRVHLTVLPQAGEVRTVVLALNLEE